MSKNVSPVKARMISAGIMGLMIVSVSSYCTQYVAEKFAYHPALGGPLSGQFYNPFAWWGWSLRYHNQATEVFQNVFLMFLAGVIFALITGSLVFGFIARSSRKHHGIHGTAHFATAEEVGGTGLLDAGKGVYVGGYDMDGKTHYLRHDGPEHVCAIAPTRSGKGVGLVIPTLLSWPESVFVLDPKGENYATTSGWRQKSGNVILRFDPAQPEISCSWNPLGEIRFGTRYQIGDAQSIALMVIDDDGKGISGSHWRTAAHDLLVGVITHALYKAETVGRAPSLQDCAMMLSGVGDFAAPVDENEDTERQLAALFEEMEAVTLGNDTAAREAQLNIRATGRRFRETASKELASIISTAHNALALYRDPIVGENTSRNDFRVADLMNHGQPVSLYFITTFQDKDRMRPLARLLLSRILLGLSGQMEFEDGRSKPTYKHRLLLMLDEFPTLGKLEVLQSALAYIAGYGMKAYLITQDVQQLYHAYTIYESIISNCHVRAAYAPTKQETAEWLSKMTGQSTVIKEQVSTSGKRFGAVLEQVSRSYQEVQRPLMTPDEIARLPAAVKDRNGNILEAGEMLVFVAGHPVIRGRQILYFLDPVFSKRSKIIPPSKSDTIRTADKKRVFKVA